MASRVKNDNNTTNENHVKYYYYYYYCLKLSALHNFVTIAPRCALCFCLLPMLKTEDFHSSHTEISLTYHEIVRRYHQYYYYYYSLPPLLLAAHASYIPCSDVTCTVVFSSSFFRELRTQFQMESCVLAGKWQTAYRYLNTHQRIIINDWEIHTVYWIAVGIAK